ncbi:thioredoxin-like domain-containing protein [Fusarium avenaceum]|nr:thioredoxin-like domain-containing protein [Fusarium avenaceum]
MRSLTLLSFIALCTPTICNKLSRTEFNILIFSRQSLILFTADGCKDCLRVQELLDNAAPALTKTAIASVNCNDQPAACDDAKVYTVPTLKFTTGNGDLVPYKEALDASSVVKYIDRQSGSPVKSLTDQGYIDFAKSARVAVVAFLGPSDSPEHRVNFNTVAERWRAHYSFGSVNALEEHSTGPSIAVYTEEEDQPVYYRGDFNVDDIETFLRDATTPLIREFDPDTHAEAIEDGKPLAQIFFDKREERTGLVKSLMPLAKQYKDQIAFLTVYAPDYPATCKQMHLGTDIKRGFVIANPQGRAYPMSTTVFNANRVAKHVSAYLAGTLTPTIKSEPVLPQNTTQPFLTTLVGSNFDEFVFDKSRDVLVEFHVPWCQYCTDLQAVMNKLGSRYSKSGLSKQVSIAAINVDANDVPIEIDSYPSIRLYRAGTNEIVSFQGNFTEMLTEEQLDSFISKSGSHGVSVLNQDKAKPHDEL